MKHITLATSSKGNCFVIQTDQTNIMIDCGISFKKINEGLHSVGLEWGDISYLVLTHSHTDHTLALRTIRNKFPNLQVVCSQQTADGILSKKAFKKLDMDTFDMMIEEDKFYSLGTLVLFPKLAVHDVHCLGYHIIDSVTDKSLVHMTDTANIDSIADVEADAYFIECNYEYEELMAEIGERTTDANPDEWLNYLYRKFDTHLDVEDYNKFSEGKTVYPLHPSDKHNNAMYNMIQNRLPYIVEV